MRSSTEEAPVRMAQQANMRQAHRLVAQRWELLRPADRADRGSQSPDCHARLPRMQMLYNLRARDRNAKTSASVLAGGGFSVEPACLHVIVSREAHTGPSQRCARYAAADYKAQARS